VPVTLHSRNHIWAWGDRRRVEQIVRNLISNARSHGGAKVWAELSGSGDHVRLAVCDDGPGLSAEAPSRVFEPYGGHRYVGERETVGLGLHVARLLARRLGGELRYRREGTVTRFELTLSSATERVDDTAVTDHDTNRKHPEP